MVPTGYRSNVKLTGHMLEMEGASNMGRERPVSDYTLAAFSASSALTNSSSFSNSGLFLMEATNDVSSWTALSSLSRVSFTILRDSSAIRLACLSSHSSAFSSASLLSFCS